MRRRGSAPTPRLSFLGLNVRIGGRGQHWPNADVAGRIGALGGHFAGLDELARLVATAGADVMARVVQRRTSPDPATYLGKGKAEELLAVCLGVDADTVVFDNDLSPAQQRNLERALSNQDVRQRFVANFVATAPQSSFLRNFEFSSIITAQSPISTAVPKS